VYWRDDPGRVRRHVGDNLAVLARIPHVRGGTEGADSRCRISTGSDRIIVDRHGLVRVAGTAELHPPQQRIR